ncbi:ATP-binding protein [Synoicihabitans lomoniglobus]|uniref:histidine kinase n=1 Tax=Synoicihabitans lomoniglobus TaxID=2909285 RepID=A0AAF0I642_9BACT|nr:ATP-binding protein [Opitutaceae bacterium LMO-M01]WED65881.1 ATP-binding protein [Opitutaceae bacterium LMO-M01]
MDCFLIASLRRGGAVLSLAGLAWLTAMDIRAQPEPEDAAMRVWDEAATGRPRMSQLIDFWTVPVEEREAGVRYRFEVDVLYYDPAWNILHVQDASLPEFLQTEKTLPLVTGQRVAISGVTGSPGQEFWIRDAQFESLGPAHIGWEAVNLSAVDHQAVINSPIEVVGLVMAQTFDDPEHLELSMLIDGIATTVWVLVDPEAPVPAWEGVVVRVRGVHGGHFDAAGNLDSLELFCPSPHHIDYVAALAVAPQFEIPVTDVGRVVLSREPGPVRLQGKVVKAPEKGQLTLRDETGQVVVETWQQLPVAKDDPLEVVGYPAVDGVSIRLTRAWARIPSDDRREVDLSQDQQLRWLHRMTASVMELTPSEAAKTHPVQVDGVVTWSSDDAMQFFLQDSSGGIGVVRADARQQPPAVGAHVMVTGFTAQGDFAPVIRASLVKTVGNLSLPRARQVTLEQAQTGVEEAQWVSMSGFVHDVRRDGGWARLDLSTSAGPLSARLPTDASLTDLVGAVVELHGVCTAVADEDRKLRGIEMWVAGRDQIEVLDPGPQNVFALPFTPISELGRFNAASSLRRRIKVQGVIMHQSESGRIYMEETGASLLVHSRQRQPLRRGDRVEVVGFPGREGGRMVLRESTYRRIAEGASPPPVVIDEPGRLRAELDGHLVRIEGHVLERFRADGEGRLWVQNGRAVFETHLENRTDRDVQMLPIEGSRIAVTGVYEVEFSDRARPLSFRLLVDETEQIEVLSAPQWWTRERAIGAGTLLLVSVMLTLLWVRHLHGRVKVQSRELDDQMNRATRLEADLQRASRLESLGTMAGGVAQDFNELLDRMLSNIARVEESADPDGKSGIWLQETRSAVSRARDLTRRLMTFAKGGAPVCAPVDLVALVQSEVNAFDVGVSTEVQWTVTSDCPRVPVDDGQLRQVVRSLLLNAGQAMPRGGILRWEIRPVRIDADSDLLLASGRYVQMILHDNGEGMGEKTLGRAFDPYFTTRAGAAGLGLAVVYSVVRRHHGHIVIESTPMLGTDVSIWLPVDREASRPPFPLDDEVGSAKR